MVGCIVKILCSSSGDSRDYIWRSLKLCAMTPKLNVLLVEKLTNDNQLFVLCLELLDLPHEVGKANTQTELFSLFYHKPKYDLIVIDIREPHWTDGKEYLRKIKTHAVLGQIPVVVCAERKSQNDIDEVYSMGAHFYAIIPYFQPNYIQMVRRIFQVEWSATPAPVRPAREQFVINHAFA